jgi:hypothetical protein
MIVKLPKPLGLLVACTLGAFTLATGAQPLAAQSPAPATVMSPGINLLTNPGHEHPGAYFSGRGEINVTWGWLPFWEEPPQGADPRDPNFRTPEFRPVFQHEYPYRVHSGNGSNRWFNFFALNRKAGIMQYVINLPIGKPIRFTTWVQLWSSNLSEQAETPPKSLQDGNLRVRLCLDQDGGPRDMTDPNLKCSDWAQPYDQWTQLSVEGVALNSAVNALIWSTADIPVEHNDIYADDSCFEVLAAPGAPGICASKGFVPTGPGVVPAPENVVEIKTSPEEQARALRQTPRTSTALAPVTAPKGDKPALAVNARTSLNLREKPSNKAKIVTNAKRGAVLSVLGKSADGQWFQVVANGKTGWVSARLTLPNSAAKAAAVTSQGQSEDKKQQPPADDKKKEADSV